MSALGYRRIGFLTSGVDSIPPFIGPVETADLTANQTAEFGCRIPHLAIRVHQDRIPAKQITNWVRTNRIDGILTDSGIRPEILAACAILRTGEVGMACLDTTCNHQVAGVDPMYPEIGRAGITLLHSLVTGSGTGASVRGTRLCVTGAWIDGDSLPRKAHGFT